MPPSSRPDLVPSLVLALSSGVWGLFWVPLRYAAEQGFEGAWSTTAYFLVGLVCLAPLSVTRWHKLRAGGAELLLTGLFAGAAIALYMLSFLFTTVAKALLIFYLTPVWSTLLSRWLLREMITPTRLAALVLGVAGLWVILGGHGFIPRPSEPGDLIALLAGISWAYASVRLNRSTAEALEWTTVFMLCGLLVSLGCVGLSAPSSTPPTLENLYGKGGVVIALIAAVSLPFNFAILWATNRLSPGRAGLLLMAEVVVGISVAAVITDEPYALREILGTALILSAALVDLVPRRSAAKV